MKISLLLLVSQLLLISTSTSQTTIILNNNFSYTVPIGQKWIIKNNTNTLIEVSEGVLNSGSMCNARFLSKPHQLDLIEVKDENNIANYLSLQFSNFERPIGSNLYTYQVYIDKIEIVKGKNTGKIFQGDYEIYQGQKIRVLGCINKIEVIETPLSEVDKARINKEYLKNKKLELVNDSIQKVRKEEEYNSFLKERKSKVYDLSDGHIGLTTFEWTQS